MSVMVIHASFTTFIRQASAYSESLQTDNQTAKYFSMSGLLCDIGFAYVFSEHVAMSVITHTRNDQYVGNVTPYNNDCGYCD